MNVCIVECFLILFIAINVLGEEKCVHIFHLLGGNRNGGCKRNDVCTKVFNVSLVHLQPYTEYDPIENILYMCCGDCVQYRKVHEFDQFSQLTIQSIQSSHFVFPVLGRVASIRMYGFHFIPIYDTSGAIYVTRKEEFSSVDMINACFALWPLMLTCIIMALLSGFLAWLAETWNNKDEFPRAFLIGWFEGFWWSWVSMTTVGYGDKTPKSIMGKIFSVAWIMIGIISFGVLTGSLTSTITAVSTPQIPSIKGSRVGAIANRLYEADLITSYGGILQPTQLGISDIEAVIELIARLKQDAINGFVLDRDTYYSTLVKFQEEIPDGITDEERNCSLGRFNNTVATDIADSGEKLSYGMLVKNSEDYLYFREAIIDNRMTIRIRDFLDMVRETMTCNKVDKPSLHIFSTDDKHRHGAFIAIAVILVLIFCFGINFELMRRRRCIYNNETVPQCRSGCNTGHNEEIPI